MLDDDELMYTRILNHNATLDEITDYIDKLHKEIKELKDKLYQFSYYEESYYNICKEYDNLLEKIDKRITVFKELKSEFRAIGENVDKYDIAIGNLESLLR